MQKQLKITLKEKDDAVTTLKKVAQELQKERSSRQDIEVELEAIQSQFDGLKATIKQLQDQIR